MPISPISEGKKKIVINNYFQKLCGVDTSIRDAFTKGFDLGLEKGYQVGKTDGLKAAAETSTNADWKEVNDD